MLKKIVTTIIAFVLFVLITISAASACGEYAVFIYKITKVENGQYWGTGVYDNSNIYFLQENIMTGEEFKVGDAVIAYFDPENTVDGLVGVERVVLVGMDNSSQ